MFSILLGQVIIIILPKLCALGASNNSNKQITSYIS